MGFRPEPTVYTLKFDNHFLSGLEVKVKACTIEEYNSMLRLSAENGKQVADNNERTTKLFLERLVDWNLEDPDEPHDPTPKTLEGIRKHEQPLLRELIHAWQMAMAGVDDDLGKDSSIGENSQERSLGLG